MAEEIIELPENIPVITKLNYTLENTPIEVEINNLPETLYFRVDPATTTLVDVSALSDTYLLDPKDMFIYGEYDSSTNPKLTHYLVRRYVQQVPDEKFDELVVKTIVKVVPAGETLSLDIIEVPPPPTPNIPVPEYIPPLPETVAATTPAPAE